jgi:type III secretory pathway component EscV
MLLIIEMEVMEVMGKIPGWIVILFVILALALFAPVIYASSSPENCSKAGKVWTNGKCVDKP